MLQMTAYFDQLRVGRYEFDGTIAECHRQMTTLTQMLTMAAQSSAHVAVLAADRINAVADMALQLAGLLTVPGIVDDHQCSAIKALRVGLSYFLCAAGDRSDGCCSSCVILCMTSSRFSNNRSRSRIIS
jgi:hypothetical protein